MANDFPTKCSKCGCEFFWDKDQSPPQGTQRFIDGKSGWWADKVDGATKIHDQSRCDALKAKNNPSPVDTQQPHMVDDVPNAPMDGKVQEAQKIYAMCLKAAHDSVNARYPKGHTAFSQIRSNVAENYVNLYCALLQRESATKS